MEKKVRFALNICYQLNFLICLLNVNTVWLVLFLFFFLSIHTETKKNHLLSPIDKVFETVAETDV